MDWKGIVEKTIVAVAAATIVAVAGWFISPIINDHNTVEAKIGWIEVPNQSLFSNTQISTDASSLLAKVFGIKDVNGFPADVRYSGRFSVGSIEIYNNSDTRSKKIEIEAKNGLLVSVDGLRGSKIEINPIDPSGSVEVYFITGRFLDLFGPSFQIIHDNKAIPIYKTQVDNAVPFYRHLVANYPIVVFMAIASMLFFGVLFIASAMTYLLVSDKTAFRAKHLSKKDTAEYIKILDYIRDNIPEKMPKEEKLLKDEKSTNG